MSGFNGSGFGVQELRSYPLEYSGLRLQSFGARGPPFGVQGVRFEASCLRLGAGFQNDKVKGLGFRVYRV